MLATELEGARTEGGSIFSLVRPVSDEGHLPLLVASAGINVLALALPIFILQIYDRVLPNEATTTLFVLIVGLAIALVFDAALRALRAYIATWNGARFEHIVRYRAVERLLRAPLDHFWRTSPGSYLERLNAVGSMRDFHASQLLLAAIDLPFALLFLALIAYLGSWLILVPLTLLVIFTVLAVAVGRALRTSAITRVEADKRRYDFIIEVLSGIQTVKALALNAAMLRRAESLQEESAFAAQRIMYQSTLAHTLGSLFGQLNMVLLVAFGALLVLDGRMTMGALAACTLLSGRALQPLQTAMGLWTNFQGIRVARTGIAEIMALPSESIDRTATPPIAGVLELRDLTFRHEAQGPAVINGITLAVRPGEIVGIDGDAGAGKSTLLLLMLGLLRPTSGSVHIDGSDAAKLDPNWLRQHIALLPRNGVVYGGTILDNITNFREGECVNEALYLSYLVGLDDTIKRLPEGFDTRIGASEVLPAGLRQRIAIVRELVKQPKIILFDDADHALDADSTRRLVDFLRQLGRRCAVVVVSAKPQVMQLAQRRYRLSRGHLLPISPATGKAQIQEVAR
jgi:ATP-binding cassette, subfamily C, bacterial LapB